MRCQLKIADAVVVAHISAKCMCTRQRSLCAMYNVPRVTDNYYARYRASRTRVSKHTHTVDLKEDGIYIVSPNNLTVHLYHISVVALLFVFRATDGHLDNTNGCETNCNFTFDPICGTDDAGKTKMFSNECVLKSENCLYKTSMCDRLTARIGVTC